MRKFLPNSKVLFLAVVTIFNCSSASATTPNKSSTESQEQAHSSELGQVPAGQADCPIPSDRKGAKEISEHSGSSRHPHPTAPSASKAEKAN